MRNSGQVIGGAISLGVNVKTAGTGAVSITTYLIFIVLECIGFPSALLLSPSSRVRRPDGVAVPLSPPGSWKQETVQLIKHIKHKRVCLLSHACLLVLIYHRHF